MPNYRRYNTDGRPVFVTMVAAGRRDRFRESQNATLLLETMRRVKALRPFRHLAHAIMPDHVHWIFVPASGECSGIVGAVKRDFTWRLKREQWAGAPPYWQDRFHDHVIRDERDLSRHMDYVHFNPVRHGVSASPSEFPFSSFREWVARGVYEMEWGSTEPDTIDGMDLE